VPTYQVPLLLTTMQKMVGLFMSLGIWQYSFTIQLLIVTLRHLKVVRYTVFSQIICFQLRIHIFNTQLQFPHYIVTPWSYLYQAQFLEEILDDLVKEVQLHAWTAILYLSITHHLVIFQLKKEVLYILNKWTLKRLLLNNLIIQ
jgi:hypothetical protein